MLIKLVFPDLFFLSQIQSPFFRTKNLLKEGGGDHSPSPSFNLKKIWKNKTSLLKKGGSLKIVRNLKNNKFI